MIEVEYYGIELTTIDAGMLRQKRKYEDAIPLAVPAYPSPFVRDVRRLRLLVVRPPRDGMTGTAAGLTLSSRNRSVREIGVEFVDSTRDAARQDPPPLGRRGPRRRASEEARPLEHMFA